ATVEPLRHRQTKGAETDMLSLTSPRHISTLREAEDAGPSKALRPTRAHKVGGCVSCSLPQCRVGREFHEKGSSAAVLGACDRKLESVTPTSLTPFGGGNTDRIRSRAT